ncbi:MAG TPA: T9SS type A sorting domain-containing protein [bacterium]|nr:T9SS type A sorting domain-containing protein [bacterium]
MILISNVVRALHERDAEGEIQCATKGFSMLRGIHHICKRGRTWLSIGLLFPVLLHASSVNISWNANTESDLAGYKVYYGTQRGVYSTILNVGNNLSYDISGLVDGTTYYFAVTAYDQSGNESPYSEEVSFQVVDSEPPQILSVACDLIDRVRVVFNEQVEKTSAEIAENYAINNGIVVQRAELQSDGKTVYLFTTQHLINGSYVLTVNNVRDRASVPNTIQANTQKSYIWSGTDEDPPYVESLRLYTNVGNDFIVLTFNEPLNQSAALNSSNYVIAPPLDILNMGIDDSFRTVYVTTACHTPGQSYSLTLNNIQDGAGNTIDTNTVLNYVCSAQDTTAPALVAARLLNQSELELEFSKTLKKSSAEQVSYYSTSPALTIQSAVLSDDMKRVILKTAPHSEGTYTITVSGVEDNATPSNTITGAQLLYNYVPPDLTPPFLQNVTLSSDNLVQLTFSEPLDQITAETVSNYTITPNIEVLHAYLNVSESTVLLETTRHGKGTYEIAVKHVKDRAQPANVIDPNTKLSYTFDPPDDIPPQLLKAVLHGSNVVVLQFSEALDRASAENTSHYLITPSVVVKSASLIGDSLNRVFLETGDHEPGQSYTIQVHSIMDRALVPNLIPAGSEVQYEYPMVDQDPPRLMSVSLHGDRTLKLTFNESLDQETAENTANYSISPMLNVEDAILDASLCQVLLTTSVHQPGVQYTITVQNVRDRADPPNTIGIENTAAYTCESRDGIPPRLTRVDLHGSTLLELSFSEPVSESTALNTDNYTIDKGISVHKATLSRTQEQVFLETSTHQKGEYAITVNGIQDLAEIPNTILPDTRMEYTYAPADDTPPVLVSVSLLSPSMISLLFNKPMDRSSVEDTTHYAISGSVRVKRAILDVDLTGVILQTSDHQPGDYTITLNALTDASPAKNPIASNTVGSYTYEVIDEIPPVIVDARLQTDTRLLVTFSEPLEPTSARAASNYAINPNIQLLDVYASPSEGKVTLHTSSHAAGTYTLTVKDIQDVSGNLIESYSQISYSYSPVDTIPPALLSAQLLTHNYIQLSFSEAVNADDANRVENYSIVPPVGIISARLASDLQTVGLVTAQHAPGNYTLTAGNIRDRAFVPNVISDKNTVHYQYSPPDTTPPQLVSVVARTPMSLALIFDEDLSRNSAETITNYSISPNIEVTEASLLASLKEVRLETTPHQPNIHYSIQISGLKDRAPIPNVMVKPVVHEYSYVPPDTSRPELVAVKLQSYNLLEVYFNEPVEKASAENRNNYTIEFGVEVLNASLDADKLTRVILETTDHMPGFQYQLQVKNVRDRAPTPNVIRSNTWYAYSMPASGGLSDDTPPQVAYLDVISSTRLDVVFSEPIDSLSAMDVSNYNIKDNVEVKSVALKHGSVRVHLTTGNHEVGKPYHIEISGIRDCAPFPNEMSESGPVKYLVANGATLSNLNRSSYKWNLLKPGNPAYVDRDYTITQIPEMLEGTVQIVTANDDKCDQDNGFIMFELRGDATVYVGYDSRISEVPEWLSSWKVTGDQVVNSRSTVYRLYSKKFVGGRVILGGNCGSVDDDMYLLFVAPQRSSVDVIGSISRESYSVGHVVVGDTYYIDRDYTVSSVPDSREGLIWISTANDDKAVRDDDFLTFELKYRSNLFIAYDSRIAALPRWLLEWELTGETIVDSRGSVFDLYTRKFESGSVTLGGNCGSSDDNMYFILVEPLEGVGFNPDVTVPGIFTLSQNYPNPFNPITVIPVQVQRAGHVHLAVYNILGRRVKVLLDREVEAGFQDEVMWDGCDEYGNRVASGVYFCRIQQGEYAKSRRMLLLK